MESNLRDPTNDLVWCAMELLHGLVPVDLSGVDHKHGAGGDVVPGGPGPASPSGDLDASLMWASGVGTLAVLSPAAYVTTRDLRTADR